MSLSFDVSSLVCLYILSVRKSCRWRLGLGHLFGYGLLERPDDVKTSNETPYDVMQDI